MFEVECRLSAACSDVLDVLRLSCSCALCSGAEWRLSAACSDVLDVLRLPVPVHCVWELSGSLVLPVLMSWMS